MLPKLLLRNSPIGDDQNLCFTNAAIQILRNIPPFVAKCMEHSNCTTPSNCCTLIQRNVCTILKFVGENRTISTHFLRKSVGEAVHRRDFFTGQQSDALEFCHYLLQNLNSSVLSLFKFHTQTERDFWRNERKSPCQYCGKELNNVNDEHLVLNLSIPDSDHSIEFQQLIDNHFLEDISEQSNGIRCPNCCSHDNNIDHKPQCKPKPFRTQEHITRYPDYLIVQLLRFKTVQVGDQNIIQKINTKVTNAKSILVTRTPYELDCILNHEGGYENGHYTALLKSEKWYLCDDIKIYEVTNDSIESEKNYVYIFKKKEPTMSGMNQPEFVPTDEFQYIPPGASVPWGCRYRMDFETGFKQARWEKDANVGGNITKKITSKQRQKNWQ